MSGPFRSSLETPRQFLSTRKLGILAFLLAASVRALPEFLAGPYPVGWDTIAFYVPKTLYWAGGNAGILAMIGDAPLIYAFSVPLSLAGVNPIWTFKVMGPLLYGLLGFSIFAFLSRRLEWSTKISLGGALLASFYFVTLRIGWDMFRNVAGLSFLLLALSVANDASGAGKKLVLAGMILLAVVSDQFTGFLSILIFGTVSVLYLIRGNQAEGLNLLRALVPGLVTFGVIIYSSLTAYGTLYAKQPPLGSSWTGLDAMLFLGYAYLPLLPFSITGAWKNRQPELAIWTIICLAGTFASSVSGQGVEALGYRWALLLTIPLSAYAAAGLVRISKAHVHSFGRLRGLQASLPKVFGVFLIIFALSYVILPPQHPGIYFSAYPGLIPTSMSQNTLPLSDSASVVSLLRWLNLEAGPSSVLITHQAIYGWAIEFLARSVSIVNYGYETPNVGVAMLRSHTYSAIFMIWWVNGAGWFGQASVPNDFVAIQASGDFAIYRYVL